MVGVARNRAALERLLALGADAVVDLRADESVPDLVARLLTASGPADVVLDGLYGTPLEAALQVCAPHARVINIGNLAGPTAQIPAGLLRSKQLSLSGFAGLHTPLQAKRPALTWLWTALAERRPAGRGQHLPARAAAGRVAGAGDIPARQMRRAARRC